MVALLMLILSQDPGISKLIEDLDAEEASVREKAAAALVDRGAEVEPELERRLSSLQGETKHRVQDCLARIKRARENAGVLPPYKPLSVEVKDTPFSDVLALIGLPRDGAPTKRVTLSASGISTLEALDRICRQSGVSWSLSARPGEPAALDYKEVPPAETVRAYIRHYRLAVESVTVTRIEDFRGGESSLKLDLALDWPSFVKPDAVVQFELLSVRDDTRRELLKADATSGTAVPLRQSPSYSRSFVAAHPAAAASTLASVKGRIVLRYPSRIQVAKFSPPDQCVGQTQTIAGVQVRLVRYETLVNRVEAELRFTGRYERRFSSVDGTPALSRVEVSLPFERDDVKFLTGDASKLVSCGSGSGSDGKGQMLSWAFRPPGSPVKSIELALAADSLYDTIDFELKDVPLPKKPE